MFTTQFIELSQRRLVRGVIVTATLLSVACAPPPRVMVEERAVLTVRQETEKLGGQLVRFVQPGDTLYSIAFINNLDVNKIAAWNSIRDTSELEVGQKIRLTEPIGFREQTAKQTKKSTPARQSAVTAATVPANGSTAVQTTDRRPISNQPPTVTKPPATTTKPVSSRPVAGRWRWPARGTVTKQFALAKGRQGIDISARQGQPVMAANRGEVVYVGNSLKGYGNLVIIKHDETYLSAYAHNKEIYVREGQQVAVLQRIGTIGANNQRQNALHFQIRKHGKPVDPMQYLPKL